MSLDTQLIKDYISPLFIRVVEPSGFAARTICRSRIMEHSLGVCLASAVRDYMHATDFGLDCGSAIDAPIDSILNELTRTREDLSRLRASARNSYEQAVPMRLDEIGESYIMHRVGKRAKGRSDSCHNDELLTATTAFVIKCRIAFKHAPSTLCEANAVLQFARTSVQDDPPPSISSPGGK